MTTTKLNWYTYNRLTEKLGSWGKNWCPGYMTHLLAITTQIFLTLVPIVWFVAIQTRTTATRMGMRWPLCEYSTFNQDFTVLLEHVIKGMTNGPIVSLQELNIFKTCMLWMMFTIFTKYRASIPVWCWHEKKKDPNLASNLIGSSGFMKRYGI